MNAATVSQTNANRSLPKLPQLLQADKQQSRRRRSWIRRLPVKLAIVPLFVASIFASKQVQAQDASYYFNCAAQWDDQGNYDKAIADYSQAIALFPYDPVAYNNRGYDYWKKGELDKAIADYNQALALCPSYGAAYSNRGVAWDDKGDKDRAAADNAQAIAVNPNIAGAYNNRGVMEAGRGEYAQANADYYRALSIDPNYATAYENLGFFAATCPDPHYRDAQKAFENASRGFQLDGGDSYYTCIPLAAAYAEAGDFEKAIAVQQKVVDFAPAADKPLMTERLELFKQHKPYRMKVAPK